MFSYGAWKGEEIESLYKCSSFPDMATISTYYNNMATTFEDATVPMQPTYRGGETHTESLSQLTLEKNAP